MNESRKVNPICGAWLLNIVNAIQWILDAEWKQWPEYRERLLGTENAMLIKNTGHSCAKDQMPMPLLS